MMKSDTTKLVGAAKAVLRRKGRALNACIQKIRSIVHDLRFCPINLEIAAQKSSGEEILKIRTNNRKN